MAALPVQHLLAACAVSVLSLGFAASAGAEIYKWTDERGVVHYSNSRPAAVQKIERVSDDRLSVVEMRKPSAEEVRALNERLTNRRIRQLEEALYAARQAPAIAYASPAESAPVYYPAGGYYWGSAHPPVGEILIDRNLDKRGRSRHTRIQLLPRYRIGPGPYGIGGQAIPVQPREPRHFLSRSLR